MVNKKTITGLAILIGTAIGAGVLGIPYVAAQSGFLVAMAFIVLIAGLIIGVNLYLGEITLRTKEEHQLGGYARKYLGKTSEFFMNFATIFGGYAAIVAYILGIGGSLSFIFFGDNSFSLLLGLGFSFFMAFLLWKGMKSFKKFEKIGVAIILSLLLTIIFIFAGDVTLGNLLTFNAGNILLPFGVVLFALMSFHAVPEVHLILKKEKKLLKRILIIGTSVAALFYIVFTLVVVGSKGINTPQIATLAMGPIFVFMGILTMFTSYLAIGNALKDHFAFDDHDTPFKSWILSAVAPIGIFLIIQMFDFFSFTKILSIGGVISGGIIAILILAMVKKAKVKGDRKPEYSMPLNWFIIGLFSLIFIVGVVRELFLILN